MLRIDPQLARIAIGERRPRRTQRQRPKPVIDFHPAPYPEMTDDKKRSSVLLALYYPFMIPVWKLNAAQVLGLACLGVWMGGRLKRLVPLLDRLNVPVPIAGGMVFALVSLALRGRVVNLEADTTLRDLLMVAFMTTIGLSARLQLVRAGGQGVIKLLGIATFGALLQNLLGMGLAKAMGLDARLGILAGSVALAGGPATSVAFGGTFEKLGVHGAAQPRRPPPLPPCQGPW
ncbi:membrane hypothetical protein [Candidatus Sulfopaludibacter sp. SbA3]|nr:membrane hypothetical protein [Candidatus Sulfopaludibacter sp. SbA3]